MKINKITQNNQQQRQQNSSKTSKAPAFGIYVDLSAQKALQFISDAEKKFGKETPAVDAARRFVAKLARDIIQHNKTESNHFVYDNIQKIDLEQFVPHELRVSTDVKYGSGLGSSSSPYIDTFYDSPKTEADFYHIPNIATYMQKKLIKMKSAGSYAVSYDLKDLLPRLESSLPKNKK